MEYQKIYNTEYLNNFVKNNFNVKTFNMKEIIKKILIDLNNFNINNKKEYINKLENHIININKLYSLCNFYVINNINKINHNKYKYDEILNIIDNFYNMLYRNDIFLNILSNIINDKNYNNSYIIQKLYNKCYKFNNPDERLQQLYLLTKKNKEELYLLKNKEFAIYLPDKIKQELLDTPLNNLIYENTIYLTINNYFKILQILNPIYNKKIISEMFQQIKPYIINYIYYHINNYSYKIKVYEDFNKSNYKMFALSQTLLGKMKEIIMDDYRKLKNYCNFNNINFENIKFEELGYYVNMMKETYYKKLKLIDFKGLNEKELFNNTLQKIIQYLSTIFNFKINKKILNNNFYYLLKNNKNNTSIELIILFNQDKFKLINIINNVNVIYLPKLNLENLLDYILPFSSYIGEIIYTSLNNKNDEKYKDYKLIFNKFCEVIIFKNINLIFPKEYIQIKQYYITLLSIYYHHILFESLFQYYLYSYKVMNNLIKFVKETLNNDDLNNNEKNNNLIKYITTLYNNYYKDNFFILDKYKIFNTILYYDIDYFKLINIDIVACTIYKDFENKLKLKKKEKENIESSILNVYNIEDVNINKILDDCKNPSINNLINIYFEDIKINNIILENDIDNELINEEDNDVLLTETAYNIQKVLIVNDNK